MYIISVRLFSNPRYWWYCGKVLGRLAQLVEQCPYTTKVAGSSPASPTQVAERLIYAVYEPFC